MEYYMKLCSSLHQDYEQFSSELCNHLIEQIKTGQGIRDPLDKAKRKRNMMRLLGELHLIGLDIPFERVVEGLKAGLLSEDQAEVELNIIGATEFAEQFYKEYLG